MKINELRPQTKKNLVTLAIALAGFAASNIAVAVGAGSWFRGLLVPICIYVILAVSLNLTVGILGELSLGHAGFMCVGAYIGCFCANYMHAVIPSKLAVLVISMLIGGISAAVFGLIIGLPCLRLKGDYLAIVTLAFGEIVRTVFMNQPVFGGALGLTTQKYGKNLYIIAFVMVLFTVFVSQNLMRSKHGRAIQSIRDNEIASRAMGVNVTYYKLIIFVISAFFAGVAGVLYSYGNNMVQSAKFGYNYSIEILVMVVLGGMGSINGSIIAAALITFLNLKLATVLTGNLAVLQNMVYALVLILIVIYNNAPALKGFREKYNLRRLIDRLFRHRKDPAFVREDEASWERIPTKIEMDELLSVDLRPGEYPEGEIPEKPDKKTDGKESR